MTALSKLFWMLCALICLAYVAFFAIANNHSVSLHLLPQSPALTAPLWLVGLAALSIGLLFTALIASIRISALRLRLYRLNKRLDSVVGEKDAAMARATEALTHKDDAQ